MRMCRLSKPALWKQGFLSPRAPEVSSEVKSAKLCTGLDLLKHKIIAIPKMLAAFSCFTIKSKFCTVLYYFSGLFKYIKVQKLEKFRGNSQKIK